MTSAPSLSATTQPLWWRSTGALLFGFFAAAGLSLGTDEVLHLLKIYPPWGESMYQPRLNALALSYRIIYGILGSYIAARFAPRNPMLHAMILGILGFIVSVAGVIATRPMHLGPAWYPIAIAVTALPCAWLGGEIHRSDT